MASLSGDTSAGKPALPFPVQEPQKDTHYMASEAISQFSWRTRSQQIAEDQAQIERSDVNQKSLENVLVSPQMRPSHPTGIVAVREAPLDQFPSLPEQLLAIDRFIRRRFA